MRVLIVDDHPLVADALGSYLRRIDAAVQVVSMESFRLAMDWLERGEAVDLVLLDYKLPGVDGLEGLFVLRRRFPDLRVVLISGIARREQMREALARGAAGVIPKDLFHY